MHHTLLSFPDIQLRQSDGHKLRGYFAKTFGDESDLFHNHNEDGSAIYRYPRIQFKVTDGYPMILGIQEGAKLLVDRFISLKEIVINEKVYPLQQKNLISGIAQIGISDDLHNYTFLSPWMALNQKNYQVYQQSDTTEKQRLLKKILIGNMLSFYRAIDHMVTENIMVSLQTNQITTSFKNQKMLAFKGQFTANVVLPDMIGLGKSVARGYGTIKKLT